MTGIAWDSIAVSLGFADAPAMWKKLYTDDKLSVAKLSKRFAVSTGVVRRELERSGIQIRKRGGPNFVKVEFTPDLEERIRANGIAHVAKELNVDPTTLYKQFYRRGRRFRSTTPPQQSTEQPDTATPDSEDNHDPENR